jgi:CobQ-like glutamine amidotransferase family enzyme
MEINIIHLFPDLLNLYGDRGNILVLKKRCDLRGITANIIEFNINDEIDISNADIIFLGGGSDREQKLVCKKLLSIKEELIKFRDDLGVIFAVCGGYQLLGRYYSLDDEKIEGLSLCDMYTEQKQGRLIGNIAIDTGFSTVVGFENHGGRTYLGENVEPLGKVIRGHGNNGEDNYEGVLYKNIFGTYLHGPLLPKNPEFADLLIEKALLRKYQTAELTPLPCHIEKLAKGYILSYDYKANK